MTKKAQIIIIILAGITVISATVTANLLINTWLDNVRQDAFDTATSRVVTSIFASIERRGEVAVNDGRKELVLIAKKSVGKLDVREGENKTNSIEQQ